MESSELGCSFLFNLLGKLHESKEAHAPFLRASVQAALEPGKDSNSHANLVDPVPVNLVSLSFSLHFDKMTLNLLFFEHASLVDLLPSYQIWKMNIVDIVTKGKTLGMEYFSAIKVRAGELLFVLRSPLRLG